MPTITIPRRDVYCCECLKKIPFKDIIPIAITVKLGDGGYLHWCSFDCLNVARRKCQLGAIGAGVNNAVIEAVRKGRPD